MCQSIDIQPLLMNCAPHSCSMISQISLLWWMEQLSITMTLLSIGNGFNCGAHMQRLDIGIHPRHRLNSPNDHIESLWICHGWSNPWRCPTQVYHQDQAQAEQSTSAHARKWFCVHMPALLEPMLSFGYLCDHWPLLCWWKQVVGGHTGPFWPTM